MCAINIITVRLEMNLTKAMLMTNSFRNLISPGDVSFEYTDKYKYIYLSKQILLIFDRVASRVESQIYVE